MANTFSPTLTSEFTYLGTSVRAEMLPGNEMVKLTTTPKGQRSKTRVGLYNIGGSKGMGAIVAASHEELTAFAINKVRRLVASAAAK